MSEAGGIPMIQDDKDWILEQFTSKVNGLKLDMIKDLDAAIEKLPCGEATKERQAHTLKIQALEQTLDNGVKFSDKLENMRSNRQLTGFKRWQLILAAIAIILGSNFMEIIKFLKP